MQLANRKGCNLEYRLNSLEYRLYPNFKLFGKLLSYLQLLLHMKMTHKSIVSFLALSEWPAYYNVKDRKFLWFSLQNFSSILLY